MFSGLKDGTYDIGVSDHSATASPVWFCNATSFQVLAGEGSSSYAVTDPKFGEYFDQQKVTYLNFNTQYFKAFSHDLKDYTDYDGHMNGNAAEEYSKVLANILKEIEEKTLTE